MLCTFGEHALEAHSGNLGTNIVAIDERRVTGHRRFLSEQFLNLRSLLLHIKGEGLLVWQ